VQPSQPKTQRPTAPAKKDPPRPKRNVTKPTPKPAAKKLRTIAAAAATSSSTDTTLLIGGLALVILVVGDTLLLSVSARYLRYR
jgi:hypothetical protein